MTVFLTSSPCIYGAPRAIVNPENSFADNLHRCLPEKIRQAVQRIVWHVP